MTHPNTGPVPDIQSAEDVQRGLEIARSLIKAGIPVFAAPPCEPDCGLPAHPVGIHHYHLPKLWTKTYPSEVNLDKWEPGWALAAVGGRAADFLDVDPRSGGDATAAEMMSAGQWPRTFGRQRTPSGGWHDIITPTGERKIVLAPGVDLQAGQADGVGLGFVYIAPTVGLSKVTGELRPYQWEVEPDTEQLVEWAGQDDSTAHVISLVQAKRATSVPRQRQPQDDSDPFMTSSSAGSTGERIFTMVEAKAFVGPYLVKLQGAQVGEIEETANTAAAVLSHFVPAFWSADQAYALLLDALSHTAYDPARPGAMWRADKFISVLDGRRPPADPWRAVLAPELDRTLFDPDAKPDTVAPPTSADEAQSMVDRLLAEMLTVDEMIMRPPPRPLVMGVLDLDSEAWIIGPPGSRKSFVALDMARCVAQGRPWQGRKTHQGLVVIIVGEGATGTSLRVKAAQMVHGALGDQLLFLPRPVQAKDAVAWEVLVAACRRLQPVMVILDTQARVTVGLEENSATDMGIYVEAVRRIREATGACVLTVHHSGRNGTDARGSSAIDGAQGTELRVRVDGEKSQLRGSLLMDKQKDMAESESGIPLQFTLVDMGRDPETDRPLTSLVLAEPDPFLTVEYIEEPWEKELTGGRAQGQILRVLRDQGRTVGLTKAECRRSLEERFGPVQRTTYNTAWSRVLERTDSTGEPIVDKVGGERYAVVSLEVLNGSGGQGETGTTPQSEVVTEG